MTNEVLARVILLPNGNTHILLNNGHAVECSATALRDLLSDAFAFCESLYTSYTSSTKEVNPQHFPVNSVPGITLIKVHTDKSVAVEYTEILQVLLERINSADEDDMLNLARFADVALLSDFKQLLLCFQVFGGSAKHKTGWRRNLRIDAQKLQKLLEEFELYMVTGRGDPEAATADEPERPDRVRPAEAAPSEEKVLDEHGNPIPDGYVSPERYAAMNNILPNTAREWAREGKIPGVKGTDRRWYLSPTAEPGDRRSQKKRKVSSGHKEYTRLKDDSYESVQDYIRGRHLVSDALRQYIRTREEAVYYEKKRYREVFWDGSPALIIDINPEYFCKAKGLTNRELIMRGEAPVVPGDEKYRYHLHHIGQTPDSPFAIIPENDHLGKRTFSIFHQSSNSEEDLHSVTFLAQRKAFWKTYLKQYDEAGSFRNIPHTSPHINEKRAREAAERGLR